MFSYHDINFIPMYNFHIMINVHDITKGAYDKRLTQTVRFYLINKKGRKKLTCFTR